MSDLRPVEYGFEIEPKGITRPMIKQVHSRQVVEVTESNLPTLYQNPPEADGTYTFTTGLKLSVFTADCIPLLFYTESAQGPVAGLHCGWRGAQQNIVGEFLKTVPTWVPQLHVVFGPSIMGCCFEVKKDLIEAFETAGYSLEPYLKSVQDRILFSLSDFVIKEQLKGFSAEHIDTDALVCTHCSTPKLPSYRRDNNTDPRIRSWIKKLN